MKLQRAIPAACLILAIAASTFGQQPPPTGEVSVKTYRSIQEAINAPRISMTSTSANPTVSCERGPFFPLGHRPLPEISDDVINGLKALGHNFNCTPSAIGSVQGVIIDLTSGLEFGGADPRRQGTVLSQPRH